MAKKLNQFSKNENGLNTMQQKFADAVSIEAEMRKDL